eukprot:12364772-Alexandrium_andersonii.AAC.1
MFTLGRLGLGVEGVWWCDAFGAAPSIDAWGGAPPGSVPATALQTRPVPLSPAMGLDPFSRAAGESALRRAPGCCP